MKKKQISEKKVSQNRVAGTNLNQDNLEAESAPSSSLSRRAFLGSVSGVTTATLMAGVVGLPSLLGCTKAVEEREQKEPCDIGPMSGNKRVNQAFQIRLRAAEFEKNLTLHNHPCNGDEELYPNKIASYSKGLPHNNLGEVDLDAYHALIRALTMGNPTDFENIPLGGVRKLANPQAALAFELEGPDSHHLAIPPAPTFNSAEQAGEMNALYWATLARDVHFSDYDANPISNEAAADLSRFSDYRGPKVGGRITPRTLFRGNTPDDLVGPYISQFLLKDVPYGATTIVQRYRTTLPGDDYMTKYADWLAVLNGAATGSNKFDPTPRYIRNGRDLGECVHWDFTYQDFLNACLILLGMGAPVDARNPYRNSLTQDSFITFGAAHILHLVVTVATCALKAAWYQKWSVHRRLRPEAFGGRIRNHLTGTANYPIHSDILNSPVLNKVFSKNGTYLLPMAFSEGSPTHPAYPSGHAVVAGACITVLKAFFNESYVIPNPVAASTDGLSLLPYTGPDLTVGGELNKLASNIAIGRNFTGVHYRSDAIEGLKLGEAVAVGIFTEMRSTYNENFGGFSVTKFDGTTVIV
jgi:PAP2 superfamily protein